MVLDNLKAREVSATLLQIKAINLSPQTPFTWSSGLRSPIYCDNRITLSYPAVRQLISNVFADGVLQLYPQVDVIAGVATGAIAHGVLVAEKLQKPFVYVRSKAKEHGLGKLVEGRIEPGQKVLVIEDLISTGGSSMVAIQALREAGADVLGLMAIFSYNFPVAAKLYASEGVPYYTLSSFPILLDVAKESKLLLDADIDNLLDWSANPEQWSASFTGSAG